MDKGKRYPEWQYYVYLFSPKHQLRAHRRLILVHLFIFAMGTIVLLILSMLGIESGHSTDEPRSAAIGLGSVALFFRISGLLSPPIGWLIMRVNPGPFKNYLVAEMVFPRIRLQTMSCFFIFLFGGVFMWRAGLPWYYWVGPCLIVGIWLALIYPTNKRMIKWGRARLKKARKKQRSVTDEYTVS